MNQILKITLTCIFLPLIFYSQDSYHNQEIFLSGANVAWINFASDIGPGYTNLNKFKNIFEGLVKMVEIPLGCGFIQTGLKVQDMMLIDT